MLRRILLLLTVVAAPALAGTVDPPMRYRVVKLDRTEISGLITTFTEEGFELMDPKKEMHKISWDELAPDAVVTLHDRLLRNATGEDWLKLGKKLLTMPGGREAANRAFGKALRVDKNLKDQVEAARKEAKLTTAPVRPGP
jgi:hypothetical protein